MTTKLPKLPDTPLTKSVQAYAREAVADALRPTGDNAEHLRVLEDFLNDQHWSPELTKANDALAAIAALSQRKDEAASGQVPQEAIIQAVARGWCHDANSHKVMDVELAEAIAAEVWALLWNPPAPKAVAVTTAEYPPDKRYSPHPLDNPGER